MKAIVYGFIAVLIFAASITLLPIVLTKWGGGFYEARERAAAYEYIFPEGLEPIIFIDEEDTFFRFLCVDESGRYLECIPQRVKSND